MAKLSDSIVKKKLLSEEEKPAKVKYENLHMTNTPKFKEVGSIKKDPSTKITKISPNYDIENKPLKDEKQTGQLFNTAKLAGEIVDDFDVGVFSKDVKGTEPKKPTVKKNIANQTYANKKVVYKAPEGSTVKEKIGGVPGTKGANETIDAFKKGDIFSADVKGIEPKKPSYKTGEGTTFTPKPKEIKYSYKEPDFKKIVGPDAKDFKEMPKAKDAPVVPKVKTGVIVEVNGKLKAKYNIISESALNSLIKSYSDVGYEVNIVRTPSVSWSNDKVLYATIKESIEAKHNNVNNVAKNLRKKAFKMFYESVKSDNNNYYETNEFKNTVETAFKLVESKIEQKYFSKLNMYNGIARIMTNNGIKDIELMTEGTDVNMAIRNIKSKINEEYGLQAKIKHLYIDGNKVDINVPAWSK